MRAHDLVTGTDVSVISVRRLGSQYVQPRTLSYNPAERAVIVTSVRLALSLDVLTADMLATVYRQWAVRTRLAAKGRSDGRSPRFRLGRKARNGNVSTLCRPKPIRRPRQNSPIDRNSRSRKLHHQKDQMSFATRRQRYLLRWSSELALELRGERCAVRHSAAEDYCRARDAVGQVRRVECGWKYGRSSEQAQSVPLRSPLSHILIPVLQRS